MKFPSKTFIAALSLSAFIPVNSNAKSVKKNKHVVVINKDISKKLSKEAVLSIAKEGYIYGLPIVFTDFTRQVTSVPNNVFTHSHKFPDHTSRVVVAPNNDTNYSNAFLDLGNEPVIINIPDTKDRYYVLPLMDAWTNVFESFGKRTTGTHAQQYIVTGPRWKGTIPAGLTQVKSPTGLVWIIGRIQVNSPDDQANFVSPIQDQFKLTPFGKWQKQDTANAPVSTTVYKTSLPEIQAVRNHELTVVKAIKQIPVENFFNYLNELLVKNPASAADSAIVKRLDEIGVKPGEKFDLSSFDTATQAALKNLPTEIFKSFDSYSAETFEAPKKGGSTLGSYQTDYLKRALVAYKGLGALGPKDAVYISFAEDQNKNILTGANKYVVHFNKGKLPPARAFWSLTMYDKDRYLTDNPIRRYAIGDRNKLKFNSDGSLDIYLQHDNPGKDKEDNWLPAPTDNFSTVLRIYWPADDYLKDNSVWRKPTVSKVI